MDKFYLVITAARNATIGFQLEYSQNLVIKPGTPFDCPNN